MEIIEKIRKEIERRVAELENDKYINLDAKVCRQSELKYLDRFLDSLQEETPEHYTGKYDEAYLQEKIAKATKSWEGVDVDKFMDEVRGRETLEEAAEKYAKDYEVGPNRIAIRAFIAGAKWQAEKDLAEMAQSKSPLSTAYANRCFENGKQAMKEQMMKEAVECSVAWYDGTYLDLTLEQIRDAIDKSGAGVDDKVKVIIVKDE